ncbi:MAG: Zn-ribbon domain-containing OB-fold protein [Chloroflexi bacterium]|nr:Zn-ribbon domain-containing OB-fold protein [Chloroflexota bacterium]
MDTTRPTLPVPLPDYDSQPFWDGCREGKLLVQRCPACDHHRYPPRPMCPQCRALGGEWIEASGRGVVYSWIVAHHPVHPAVVDQVPYNVAIVELAEGPRMVSNVVDAAPEELRAGLPVEVIFEPLNDTITLPKFRKAGPSY